MGNLENHPTGWQSPPNQSLAVVPHPSPGTVQAFQPAMDLAEAVSRYKRLREFVGSCLVEDVDFGIIPGTEKKVLLKPGSEKLGTFFGFFVEIELMEKTEDWAGSNPRGIPFFCYTFRATVTKSGVPLAVCFGSANSWEAKYRMVWNQKECPKCHAKAVIFAKRSNRFLCLKDRGGCGESFVSNHPALCKQPDKIDNPNPFDHVGTVLKIAQKRAEVGAMLKACNASDYFTTGETDPEGDDLEVSPADRVPDPTPEVGPSNAKAGSDLENLKNRLAKAVEKLAWVGVSKADLVAQFGAANRWDWGTLAQMVVLWKEKNGNIKRTTEPIPVAESEATPSNEPATMETVEGSLDEIRGDLIMAIESLGLTTKHVETLFQKNFDELEVAELAHAHRLAERVADGELEVETAFPAM